MNELQRLKFWINGIGIGFCVAGVLSIILASYWLIVIGAILILVFAFIDTREPEEPPDIDTITLQIPDEETKDLL